MWGLMNYGNPSDFEYDVVSGISAGAINAAGLAGFAAKEGPESAQFLSDTWASLYNSEIWQTWPDKGLLWGCLTEKGCLNTDPALQFLKDMLATFPEGYKRQVALGATDVKKGEFVTFTNQNTSFDSLHQAALASGSIPFVFPP